MKSFFKATLLAAVIVAGTMMLTSCGTPFPLGCLYTNVYMPGALGDGTMEFNSRGYASCYNFLGWFAGGSASHYQAAKAVGGEGMKKISWTTLHIENYLGIFGRYTNVVYGMSDEADPTVRSMPDYE